jgi:hypothetical protein
MAKKATRKAKRKAPTKRALRRPVLNDLESEDHPNFRALREQGIVASKTLHPSMISLINSLSCGDVEALIRVHGQVGSLGVFFDGITPQ